jgi:hypothetical protein
VGDDQRLDSNMPIDIAPEYRRLAHECFSVAAQVDPKHRAKLRCIAELLLSLAIDELAETRDTSKKIRAGHAFYRGH